MSTVKHHLSIVESERIQPDVTIAPYAHVFPEVEVGSGSRIGESALIERNVKVGRGVSIGARAMLCEGMSVEDAVLIGPDVLFAKESPLRHSANTQKSTDVRRGARIGSRATILHGLTIGEYATVCPGAVVTHDVPHHAIVDGHPSRIVGYVDAETPERSIVPLISGAAEMPKLRVKGAALISISKVTDMRGVTSFAEVGKQLPFVAQRYFVVTDVPGREIRGEHAHKTLHEFLVCLKGSLSVMLDDGSVREEIVLDTPTIGLHVPPQVWRVVYKYSADTLMLSLCSHVYDPGDYIRDYAEFLSFIESRQT